ncbi:hypothetical protein M433DRAFT_150138 [Acidomyces richmondensis BFW]|nr:MAG: hypothetical protein FE78DRAFT_94120 [Acidomyces sp. 'richmondensis']KYG49276.1 hypothetical protein M433DRAFT_150138 [Acidomyces richmondensis BFW]
MERQDSPPVVLSANLDGPLDPHDFYNYGTSPLNEAPGPLPRIQANGASAGPESRSQPRSASNPPQHGLNSVRSHPVLLPSRAPGNVKDIANKINQGAAGGGRPPQTSGKMSVDRIRGPTNKAAPSRSPVGSPGSRGESAMTKLQKRRPGQPKSPQKSPQSSFETSTDSFSSNGTKTSTKSQPQLAQGSRHPQPLVKAGPYASTRPLFGELTAEGWHGNFDLANCGQIQNFQPTSRRQSDGGAALGHGRSQSHQDISQPNLSPPKQKLLHKRSRSEMDALQPQLAPSMPNLHPHNIPALYPTPPNSVTRSTLRKDSPTSRIPVSSRRQSQDSASASDPYSRSASAMSNPAGRRRLSKSPTRKQVPSRENVTPSSIPRSRYHPPPISTQNQTLSAKIVAPLPKTSPPLRSSRPRQPVSSATTSASRARAAGVAERLHNPTNKDLRRPSEQWLGKPYEPHKERTRKIPELGKIDFAERRARIQKAISQNLEENKSRDNTRSQSRKGSLEVGEQIRAGAESIERGSSNETEVNAKSTTRARGISLNTSAVDGIERTELEPMTAGTEFEVDESPVLGRGGDEPKHAIGEQVHVPGLQHGEFNVETPVLLSSATYNPQSAGVVTPSLPEVTVSGEHRDMPHSGVLGNAMSMRRRSESSASKEGTEFAEDSPSAETSPSDIEDRWGLVHNHGGDQGSIRIMLDEDHPSAQLTDPWAEIVEHDFSRVQNQVHMESDPLQQVQQYNQNPFPANGYTNPPVREKERVEDGLQETPRKEMPKDDTLRSVLPQINDIPSAKSNDSKGNDNMAQALDEYQKTGMIVPEMLGYLEKHSVDLQRVSANGGSNALMVQNLLDSMRNIRHLPEDQSDQRANTYPTVQYEMPIVTPDTPSDADMAVGTAVVFRNGHDSERFSEEEDEDFEAKIRKADEEWERQQRQQRYGVSLLGAEDTVDRPTPPPKDDGYTPRLSTGPNCATLAPNFAEGLRISTGGDVSLADIQTSGETTEHTPVNDAKTPSATAPPHPSHAPPPPPSPSMTARLPYAVTESFQKPTSHSERGSSEMSPRVRKNLWGPPTSSRPSTESQRPPGPPSLPGGQSVCSFAGSTRHNSIDTGGDSNVHLVKTASPGPEQKRLMKRRHIIKELLDTEHTYHQDLKIIEDIYKATAADLISQEDKKTLFGNCDEIERFSLHFYDEMRKAVAAVYIPPKQIRWAGKRGSYSTMQSDATGQASMMSTENVDDEKDRSTTIGKCFLQNLQRMDQVYGTYLKNHDAANQRLQALKNTSTVKCWLDECHNNASDITSAWDLDSLLVKPTQRVSKYPMLLHQLIDTTPPNHPDYDSIKAAAKDSIAMLTRINEAKKRADIVDQIINRKGKDTDVRSGLAKAFGRRTEKLKERVGIAEAFQDPHFDELSHKFGGHFIRLQICMRDVQDYIHRIDKTMDQISSTAAALELFTDVLPSTMPEIEAKWRKFAQVIREIYHVAFPDHKAAVQKRVIQPMITCIKLHDGPQNAMAKRKKRIIDYAKCKSIEKRGEKPDKKTLEASEMYEALNEQLKIELPKLYNLTARLVQACLNCFLDIQQNWFNMWERKLGPILEAADIPSSIQQIEPAFRGDHELVKGRLVELGICNGAFLADSSNFLSPTTTLVDNAEFSSSSIKRPSTLDGSKRTSSAGSDSSPMTTLVKRYSNGYGQLDGQGYASDGRFRSNSSLSTRGATTTQNPGSGVSTNQPWSAANTPTSSFTTSRPGTANPPSNQTNTFRQSTDCVNSPRPSSQQTNYYTPRLDQTEGRSSNPFVSALPPDESTRPSSPNSGPSDLPVMFVCASLFEFSIDKTRKEAGYPYLTYVQGEVFDVIAQKGELWLARNQDDEAKTLGWIWEQHFVILSQD